MSFCPKCGQETKNEAKFCPKCGNAISENETNIQMENETGVVTEVETSMLVENAQQPQLKSNKKKKKFILAGVIIVFALSLIGVFAKGMWLDAHPFSKLLYGMDKIYNADTLQSTTKTTVEFDALPDDEQAIIVMKLIEHLSFVTKTKVDNKNDKIELNTDISFKDQSITSAQIYMDKELVAVKVPIIKDDYFYLKWNDIGDLLEELDGPKLHIKEYKTLLDVSNSKNYKDMKKDYYAFFKEKLTEHIEKGEKVDITIKQNDKEKTLKCSELVIKMKEDEVIDIWEVLLEKVSEDKNAQALIKGKFVQFTEILKKTGDMEELRIDEDDLKTVVSDFDENYEEAWDEFMQEVKHTKRELKDMDSELVLRYRFDSKNRIRNIITKNIVEYVEPYSSESLGFTTTTETTFDEIDEKVNIENLDLEDGINVAETSQREWRYIEKDIQGNIMSEVFTNPILQKIMRESGFRF